MAAAGESLLFSLVLLLSLCRASAVSFVPEAAKWRQSEPSRVPKPSPQHPAAFDPKTVVFDSDSLSLLQITCGREGGHH